MRIKVFKNGPSQICGNQSLKKILLGPFLITLTRVFICLVIYLCVGEKVCFWI